MLPILDAEGRRELDKTLDEQIASAEQELRDIIAQEKRRLAEYKAKCGPKDGSNQGSSGDAGLPEFFTLPLLVATDSGTHCEYRKGGPKVVIGTVMTPVRFTPFDQPTAPAPTPQPTGPAATTPPAGPPSVVSPPKQPAAETLPPCEELIRLTREVATLSANADDGKLPEAARAAARQKLSDALDRIKQLRPLCRGKTGKPIPSGPIPEGLPPCEELQRVYAAIEKESADAADVNFSDADRAAANQRVADLTERAKKLQPLCRQARTNSRAGETPPTQTGTTKPPVSTPTPTGDDPRACEDLKKLVASYNATKRAGISPFLDKLREAESARGNRNADVGALSVTAIQDFLRTLSSAADLVERAAKKCPSYKYKLEEFTELEQQNLNNSSPQLAFPFGPPPQLKPGTPSEQRPVTKITIFFKATSEAIERGANAKDEFGGQRAKLFTPDVVDRSLPPKQDPTGNTDQDKLAKQDGAGKDPIVSTLDDKGFDVLTIDPADLTNGTGYFIVIDGFSSGEPGPYTLDVTLDVTKQDSRNVFFNNGNGGDGMKRAGDLADALANSFGVSPGTLAGKPIVSQVGDTATVTVSFAADMAKDIEEFIRNYAGVAGIEINICRTKEPLVPRPEGHYAPAPARDELRGASLGLAELGLGGAP